MRDGGGRTLPVAEALDKHAELGQSLPNWTFQPTSGLPRRPDIARPVRLGEIPSLTGGAIDRTQPAINAK